MMEYAQKLQCTQMSPVSKSCSNCSRDSWRCGATPCTWYFKRIHKWRCPYSRLASDELKGYLEAKRGKQKSCTMHSRPWHELLNFYLRKKPWIFSAVLKEIITQSICYRIVALMSAKLRNFFPHMGFLHMDETSPHRPVVFIRSTEAPLYRRTADKMIPMDVCVRALSLVSCVNEWVTIFIPQWHTSFHTLCCLLGSVSLNGSKPSKVF